MARADLPIAAKKDGTVTKSASGEGSGKMPEKCQRRLLVQKGHSRRCQRVAIELAEWPCAAGKSAAVLLYREPRLQQQQPPSRHQSDAVAQQQRFTHVMGNKHDCFFEPPRKVNKFSLQARARERVERPKRFVE